MKVSIVIPVYNAKDFIVQCLDSVAKQTMTDGVECILVDDCGTDDSIAQATKWIEDYRLMVTGGVQFKILHQDNNQGPSAARNRGIREAQGEYLFFLDADNKTTPQCIETLYSLAEEYGADYVQGTYQSDNKLPPPTFLDNKKAIKKLLLNYNKISFTPHNRLVRRQMILEHKLFFNEQIKVREDFLWMTFVAKHVNRFASTLVETYIRGFNEDSLTHNINRDREVQGYKVLIETMCENIDPYLKGIQKNLIFETLIICIRLGFCDDKESLISKFAKCNNPIERLLMCSYFTHNNHISLWILQQMYKL